MQHELKNKTQQHLKSSESIENERNRIYDVVNSSAFALNTGGVAQHAFMASRPNSNGSPVFGQF